MLGAAAKTWVEDVCRRSHPGDTGVLEYSRKPRLKKKRKRKKKREMVCPERAKWRETMKMAPACLHPREHPAGPTCMSNQEPTPQVVAPQLSRWSSPTPSLGASASVLHAGSRPGKSLRVHQCLSRFSPWVLPLVFKARCFSTLSLRCRS